MWAKLPAVFRETRAIGAQLSCGSLTVIGPLSIKEQHPVHDLTKIKKMKGSVKRKSGFAR